MFLLLILPESPSFLLAKDRKEETLRLFRRSFGSSMSLPEIPDLRKSAPDWNASDTLLSRQWMISNITLWIAGFATAYVVFTVIAWIPTILTDAGIPIGVALLYSALLSTLSIVGPLMNMAAWRSLGTRNLLHMAYGMYVLVLLLVPWTITGPDRTVPVAVAVAALGYAIGTIQAGLYTIAGDVYPVDYRSRGVGGFVTSVRIGGIVGVAFGGFLLGGSYGLLPFSVLMSAMLALAVTSLFLLCRRTERLSTR